LANFRAEQMLAPCVTKWPTNSGKVLLRPSFIRLKRSRLGFSKNKSTCGNPDAFDQALVDFAVRTFSWIDVLFNNAAMAYFNWLEDMLSVQLPQASMPELMCGWGCHMGFPEASEDWRQQHRR
jgi:hypothetical protein